MKSIYVFFCFLFSITNIFSQEIDYAGELSKSVEVPQSPEAAAFEKYGNVGVSLYTGTPNISVPIYTINGREMDLPISLSYDASGVKVTQLASQVGLSWSLAVGGRISRVVNGMPDDYLIGDYASIFRAGGIYSAQGVRDKIDTYSLISTDFNSLQEGQNYLNFLQDINVNKVDSEPDYFSINVPGFSDYVVMYISLTGNLQAKALKNPNVKVVYTLESPGSINTWTITLEDGTNYFFNAYETTHVTANDLGTLTNGIIKRYASSWVLTKIESPNKKDVYELIYKNFGFWTQPAPIGASSVTNTLDPSSGVTEFTTFDSSVNYSPTYQIKQQYLTQIKHNTKVIVDFELAPRLDIERSTSSYDYDTALESITIKNMSGTILKKYELEHSYFGAASIPIAQGKQPYEVRLKLDGIKIKGNMGTNEYASYQFEYFSPDNVPSTKSFSQDYLGYYNGKPNGTKLYPRVEESGFIFHGANRGVVLNDAKKGNLQKITYPTGGSTEFFYESHSYPITANPQTQTVEVIKGFCIASATQGNPDGAAGCIEDSNGTDINIETRTFEITETDDYDIVFQRAAGLAFIHKLNYTCTGGYDWENPLPGSNPEIYPCLESSYEPKDPTPLCLGGTSGSVWESASNYDSKTIQGHDRVEFTPGVYQITVFNTANIGQSNNGLTIYVTRDEEQFVANAYSTTPAGLRVGKTLDDPGMGQTKIEKTYKYVTDIATPSSSSSGRLLFNPKLYTITTYDKYIHSSGNTQTVYNINRVAQAAGGNQPHVVYSKVYEVQDGNGYIEHNFNTGFDGIVARSGSPYTNGFTSKFAVGKESVTNVYSETDNILSTNSKAYNDELLFSQRSLALTNNGTRLNKYPFFDKINPTTYRLGYVNAFYASIIVNGYEGPATPQFPPFCDDPDITCINDIELSALEPVNALTSGKAGHMYKNEIYSTYNNGTSNKVIDYIYNVNNFLKETKTTDSNGNSYKTINYYPSDDLTNTVYEDMHNDYRLNTVIKTESYYNEVITGARKTVYKKWGNSYLPDSIQSAKDGLELEGRIKYHSYYTSGNVREISLVNGAKTVYIWGYNNQYPVAKIENTTYAEIEALFYFPTGFDLGASGLSILQENDLRDNLPNALITTYSYISGVGISSITDATKNKITYEYDDFNRLKQVKDKNGQILSYNEYHYKD